MKREGRGRAETILGKCPAILNGHQPPLADYPYKDLILGEIDPKPWCKCFKVFLNDYGMDGFS